MPLDANTANAKTAAINEAFAAIGTDDATRMPRCRRNSEPVAWEFHIASHLARMAEARKKTAHAAAVKAGIMFDHERDPLPAGTNTLTYAGDVIEIAVSVAAASTRVDVAALLADLAAAGVARKLLDKLVAKHTTANRAPHRFTSSLITT